MTLLPAQTSTPHGLLGRVMLEMDARPKILLTLFIGLTLWRLPVAATALLLMAGAFFCACLGGFARGYLVLWKAGLVFVLVWTGLKFALDVQGGAVAATACADAADLGLRLAVIMLFGFSLALSSSPHRLGIGLAWFLRPVTGEKSWRIALSLALMIHFFPLLVTAADGLMRNLSLRWPDCPWRERLRLIPQALLRIMSQATWNQTVAIAARGLDRPDAWQPDRPVRLMEWLALALPGFLLMVLAMTH